MSEPKRLLFRTWKKDRDTLPYWLVSKRDECHVAGRPKEFYVRPGIPNLTACPCAKKYRIILSTLPAVWQRIARKTSRPPHVADGFYTCNCQGRVIRHPEAKP